MFCCLHFEFGFESSHLGARRLALSKSKRRDQNREMVWEGLKLSDCAENVVLVTLMPVKAMINIRELSHETMAELDITKVEIGSRNFIVSRSGVERIPLVDFDSNRFDEILTSIRRGGNGDVALAQLKADDDDGSASPQIVHNRQVSFLVSRWSRPIGNGQLSCKRACR